MRSPEQTEQLIQIIAATLRQFPHLRFGQLMGNCFDLTNIYYTSDMTLINALKAYMKEHKQ